MTGLLGTHVPQIFKLHKAMFLEFIELNVMKGNETRMQMGAASQAQNHVTSRSVRATCGFASYVISGRNCGSRLAAKRLKGIKKNAAEQMGSAAEIRNYFPDAPAVSYYAQSDSSERTTP